MKAPAFWYQPGSLWARILSPASALFHLAGRLRKQGTIPYTAPIPVICVGNIVVGGAGKTPTAIAIAHLLKKHGENPAFVTRGYGGREAGPLLVDPDKHTAADVGDEALLLARIAPTWIGRARASAVRAAEKNASCIIMDDGLQNPSITPWINILVVDGKTGLGNEQILPAGPLRERLDDVLPRIGASILVGHDDHDLTYRLGHPVLGARLEAYIPDDFPDKTAFLAFAGIGQPDKFFTSCRDLGLQTPITQAFDDHHPYTTDDLRHLFARASLNNLQLLTTAKDWVRLPKAVQEKVTVLPAHIVFDDPDHILRILQSSILALRAAS